MITDLSLFHQALLLPNKSPSQIWPGSLSRSCTDHPRFLYGLQAAFPEDTQETVVLIPTLPPIPSPTPSAHWETNAVTFFCTSGSSGRRRKAPARVCRR